MTGRRTICIRRKVCKSLILGYTDCELKEGNNSRTSRYRQKVGRLKDVSKLENMYLGISGGDLDELMRTACTTHDTSVNVTVIIMFFIVL